MIFTWTKMSAENYAAFERLMGLGVFDVSGTYWSRVRPFYYRPLLIHHEHHPDSIRRPQLAGLGGVQYAVPPTVPSNSFLNFFMLEQTRDYTVEILSRKPRKQVRLASRDYAIKLMTSLPEFKEAAFPVYRSFFQRTQYTVGSQRRNIDGFSRWADRLFAIPGVQILGGYRGSVLRGVSLSFLIEDTLDFASFCCDDIALQAHLSDLMLHTIRESVASDGRISRISLGMYKGDPGLDCFKVLRGATLFRQRARLEMNPFVATILRTYLPSRYEKLLGVVADLPNAGSGHPEALKIPLSDGEMVKSPSS